MIIRSGMRGTATHPKLGNAMRVAATHPSDNTQWNEGDSDTPYTVIKEATEVSTLRWVGVPPSGLCTGKSGRRALKPVVQLY